MEVSRTTLAKVALSRREITSSLCQHSSASIRPRGKKGYHCAKAAHQSATGANSEIVQYRRHEKNSISRYDVYIISALLGNNDTQSRRPAIRCSCRRTSSYVWHKQWHINMTCIHEPPRRDWMRLFDSRHHKQGK